MNARLFAIIIAGLIFIFVIDLIRRRKMTFKYSLSWLAGSLFVLLCAIYDKLLFAVSRWIGFTLPSNFIFFLTIVFFTLLSLALTVYIDEQNKRSEALAQDLGIVKLKLEKLEKKITGS